MNTLLSSPQRFKNCLDLVRGSSLASVVAIPLLCVSMSVSYGKEAVPVSVSVSAYSGLSCVQLKEKESSELDAIVSLQEKLRSEHEEVLENMIILGVSVPGSSGLGVDEILTQERKNLDMIHHVQHQQSCSVIQR